MPFIFGQVHVHARRSCRVPTLADTNRMTDVLDPDSVDRMRVSAGPARPQSTGGVRAGGDGHVVGSPSWVAVASGAVSGAQRTESTRGRMQPRRAFVGLGPGRRDLCAGSNPLRRLRTNDNRRPGWSLYSFESVNEGDMSTTSSCSINGQSVTERSRRAARCRFFYPKAMTPG